MEKIKKVQRILGTVFDIRDTVDLIIKLFSIGGTVTMITAAIHWIGRNIPPLSLILFSTGLFMFLLAILPRIIPGVFTFLRKKGTDKRSGIPTWTENIFAEDETNLEKRLIVQPWSPQWIFSGLKQTDAYIEVIIKVTNTAIFSVVVTGMSGSFIIDGSPCHWDATIKAGNTSISHGDIYPLCINQRITKEMADLIMNHKEKGEPVDINLGQSRMLVQAEVPNRPNEIKKVFIGGQNTVEIPRNL